MSATPVAEEIVYYNDTRYESREGIQIPVSSIEVTDKRVVGGGTQSRPRTLRP